MTITVRPTHVAEAHGKSEVSYGKENRAPAQPRPTVRAAGLIFGDAGLLLVKQRRLDREYWLLPGGGVHFGESLAEALRRELREELRLEIDVGRPLALAEAISDDMARYPKHVVHVIIQARLSTLRRARALAATSPSRSTFLRARRAPRAHSDAADHAVSRDLLRGYAAADALPRRRLVAEKTGRNREHRARHRFGSIRNAR